MTSSTGKECRRGTSSSLNQETLISETFDPTNLGTDSVSEALHPGAQKIKASLDEKVVGQKSAKIQLSVLLAMHLHWFKHQERMQRSPNAIFFGPTGVGKTHSIRVASEHLKIPFVSVDATSIVPSGIVGLQIEDILSDLVREAEAIILKENRPRPDPDNDDIELARQGIIFLDEFDKIAVGENIDNQTASSLRLVQRRLLKLTEGAILGVGVTHHGADRPRPRSIDTSGILILAGGAFSGIDTSKIRGKRPEVLKRELSLSDPNVVLSADIVNYGFIPELVARLPVLVEYEPLTEGDLRNILDNPKVSPAQVWVEYFEGLNKTLIIDDSAKEFVVRRAITLAMGARGLQQVLFPCLAKIAYEVEMTAEQTYTLTAEILRETVATKRGVTNHD